MKSEADYKPLVKVLVCILIKKEGYNYLPTYKKWLVRFLIKLFAYE